MVICSASLIAVTFSFLAGGQIHTSVIATIFLGLYVLGIVVQNLLIRNVVYLWYYAELLFRGIVSSWIVTIALSILSLVLKFFIIKDLYLTPRAGVLFYDKY